MNPQSGVRTLEATAEVSLAYFEQFFVSPFHCECIARNSGGELKSRPATIVLARKSKERNSKHMLEEKSSNETSSDLIYFCRSRKEFHLVASKCENRTGLSIGTEMYNAKRNSASCSFMAKERA